MGKPGNDISERIEVMALEGFYRVNYGSRVAYYVMAGMLGFFSIQVDLWKVLLVGGIYLTGVCGMEIVGRQSAWVGQNDLAAAQGWRNRFLPWLCLCGLAWALQPVLFDIPGHVEYQAIAFVSLTVIVFGNLIERSVDWLTFRCYQSVVLVVGVLGTVEPLFSDYSHARLALFAGFLSGMAYSWRMAQLQRDLEWERISLTVESTHAHDKLHAAYGQLEKIATKDQLTGLNNRTRLDDVLKTEVARATRYNQDFTLIVMDIDNFKNINDKWGHPVGDDVLRAVGRLIRQTVRQPDIAGRWGGEEFLVLCPETGSTEGAFLAERLRKSLATMPLESVGYCTGSFGVATLAAGEQETGLLKRADEALYAAKSQGKNRVISYSS